MTLAMRIMNGLRALFRRRRAEDELDAELRAFLETAVEQKIRAGLNREEATRAARIMGKSRPVELWTPLVLRPGDRSNAFLQVVARLRPDVTIEQAQAGMEAIAARLAEQVPPDRRIEGGRQLSACPARGNGRSTDGAPG